VVKYPVAALPACEVCSRVGNNFMCLPKVGFWQRQRNLSVTDFCFIRSAPLKVFYSKCFYCFFNQRWIFSESSTDQWV